MKKLVAFALCALMVFSVFANGEKETTTAKADGPVTLVYAEVNPLDTIVGMTAQYFKEQVETLTNGSVIIDIQASGVLGSENDVLDGMMGGATTVDISRISAFALTGYGAKKSMLLSLPFTFESRDHYWNFANSDLAAEPLSSLEPLANAHESATRAISKTAKNFFMFLPLVSVSYGDFSPHGIHLKAPKTAAQGAT